MVRQAVPVVYTAVASPTAARIFYLISDSNAIQFNEIILAFIFVIVGIAQIFYAVAFVKRLACRSITQE